MEYVEVNSMIEVSIVSLSVRCFCQSLMLGW